MRRDNPTVLMLLTNAYEPDTRVRQEALALIRVGFRVRLLAWDRDLKHASDERMEGVEVRRVFLRSLHGRGASQIFFYALLYFKMLWTGLRTPFDVVHCHDLDTLPLGYVLGRLKRKPVVYDSHESFPDMLAGSVPDMLRRALAALETFFIRRVSLLITVGEKLRQHFAERGAGRTVVIGNWKSAGEYARTAEQNRQVRRGLGIPEGAVVVVCITQLLKDRKLEEIVRAVESCPGVYLLVGGRGVLEAQLQHWAAANPRVVYVGFVRSADIPSYTCAADIVYYGFDPDNPNARFSAPNKLYEALAAGKPLITGDFGEIAEVVRTAQCGVLIPEYSVESVRQAILELLDPVARAAMARNAKRFGSELSWENAEQLLYREYAALLPRALRRPIAKDAAQPEWRPAPAAHRKASAD